MSAGLRKHCRSCGKGLSTTLIDLGLQPPSNALTEAGETETLYPLIAKVCSSCELVQLAYDVPPAEMFGDYPYFSSYSKQWLAQCEAYAEMAIRRFGLNERSQVVEIGSNDGYLLQYFDRYAIPVLGVDPSQAVAIAARLKGIETIVDFFGEGLADRMAPVDLIIANNVLAHVPDLNDFLAGIALLLKYKGCVTFEFPHLLTLIERGEFDTIYHEHYSYFSLKALEPALRRHGLYAYDVDELPTHGGSLRLYASRNKLAVSPDLARVREKEGTLTPSVYREFAQKAYACKLDLWNFLSEAKAQGKRVCAYGAAAKGNTLLNYCNPFTYDLHRHIECVGDITPAKQGKLLPGSHIPIVSEDEMMSRQPDYMLILPWNWQAEIRERLKAIHTWGGKFVTAVPWVRIYES